MIETKTTLFQPMTIGLRAVGGYRDTTPVGSRIDWSPMAAKLDWSSINGFAKFYVCIQYTESVETCKKSTHEAYNGMRDYKRVPNGKQFGRTICRVRCGRGDHIVCIENNGTPSERIIPENQVIATVRLFLSVQFIRRGLDMLINEYEQLGAYIVKDTVRLTIRPVKS